MIKNTAGQTLSFQAVSATDGSPVTTGTPVVYVLGDGGTQATGTGTTTHEGNACWSYVPTQAETNYDHIAFTFTLATAVNQTVQVYTREAVIDVNVAQVSASTVAADNLELQYSGTGLTGDTFPSTQLVVGEIQSSVSNLANVGSATNKPAASYTLTTGTQTGNTFASTAALDGVYHTHSDAAGTLDLYYEFSIGSGSPASVTYHGYVNSSNDDINIFGYDWVAAGWVQIGQIFGKNNTANETDSFPMFIDMVGSGANEGLVRVRMQSTGLTSSTLAVDQLYLSFNVGADSYEGGAVWFDSNSSNAGTEVNIDGTARNPVSTVAALITLLGSTGLSRVQCTPGSVLTLNASFEGYDVNGNGSTLNMGGQNIGGTVFSRFSSVSGVALSTGSIGFFEDCVFGTATIPPSLTQQCGFGATLTQSGSGDYTHVDCYSTVAGSGSPVFTINAAGVATVEYRRFSGGITQSGIDGSDIITISGELGTVTLNGADGLVEIRGTYKAITDNRTGSPVLNTDGAVTGVDTSLINTVDANVDDILVDTGTTIPAQIATLPAATDIVTGGAITTSGGAVSNVTNNADMRGTDNAMLAASYTAPDNTSISTMAAGIIEGATQAGTLSTAQATTSLSGYADDMLIGRIITFTSGNVNGEQSSITDYANVSGLVTFDALTLAPDVGVTFKVT